MKRNLIFWGTVISAGMVLVLMNIYVYQPEKKTITFFKVEDHKIVPPKTIVHNKHHTEKPENRKNEKKDTEKKSKTVSPDTPQEPNNTRDVFIKTEIIPKTNNSTITSNNTYKNPVKDTKIENTPIKQEKQNEEVRELPFTQPLYHIKENNVAVKNEVKKPEVVHHEQKFFEYRHALKTYFEQNTPHSEYLWIVDDKDYVHTTSQNSKIKLHNTIFVDKYGKTVQGEVVLEFKELLNGKSMFKANVNTNLDKNQKRAHQIWYISAIQKKKPVFMGANTVITVQTQSKEPLSFYIGKRNFNGEIEWKPVSENQIEKIELNTGKKQNKMYEYYCNLSELGWVAAFYEESKKYKPLTVNVKAPSDVSANEISVYYIGEKTNYPLYNTNQFSLITNNRSRLARKIKKYTQGNLFEGNILENSKGKIIAIAYDKGNYYFAQTSIYVHKEQIELNLLPVKQTEINEYICND